LALAVVREIEDSKAKYHHFADNLLTPEGLGVSEKIFHILQVSAARSHI
jgi:hypothetical protein